MTTDGRGTAPARLSKRLPEFVENPDNGTTVAEVLLGLMTPASAWLGTASLLEVLQGAGQSLRSVSGADRHAFLDRLNVLSRETISPLGRLEVGLHPWVGFAIMPLFALANASARVQPSKLADPVAVAVAAALVFGKPIGILLLSWTMIRMNWAALPAGVTWPPVLVGTSCLTGIGFTMSLFIASLGLEGETLASAKTGILAGSLVSSAAGLVLLAKALPRSDAASTAA